jgi:hypothetical protein
MSMSEAHKGFAFIEGFVSNSNRKAEEYTEMIPNAKKY